MLCLSGEENPEKNHMQEKYRSGNVVFLRKISPRLMHLLLERVFTQILICRRQADGISKKKLYSAAYTLYCVWSEGA